MHKKTIIQTSKAPANIGPYSQAVGYAGLFFLSGQIAIDPETNTMIMGGVEVQTRRVMENIQALLDASGLDFSHVLKATIFLKNMSDYHTINEIYSEYFESHAPARSAIEVSRLPKDALVEIEIIAAAPPSLHSPPAVELPKPQELSPASKPEDQEQEV